MPSVMLNELSFVSARLTAIGYSNIILRTFPARKQFNHLPLVIVSPLDRPLAAKAVAFNSGTRGHVQEDFRVQAVYVAKTDLDNETPLVANDFCQDCINNLFPLPLTMPGGTYDVDIKAARDFNRRHLLAGYVYTAVEIVFHAIVTNQIN